MIQGNFDDAMELNSEEYLIDKDNMEAHKKTIEK